MKKLSILFIGCFCITLISCKARFDNLAANSNDDVYYNPAKDPKPVAKTTPNPAVAQNNNSSNNSRQTYNPNAGKIAATHADSMNPNYKDPNFNYDDYYDNAYAARVSRFQNPIYGTGYYDSYYTNQYSYTGNPSNYGNSIYNNYPSNMYNSNNSYGMGNYGSMMGYNNMYGNSMYGNNMMGSGYGSGLSIGYSSGYGMGYNPFVFYLLIGLKTLTMFSSPFGVVKPGLAIFMHLKNMHAAIVIPSSEVHPLGTVRHIDSIYFSTKKRNSIAAHFAILKGSEIGTDVVGT